MALVNEKTFSHRKCAKRKTKWSTEYNMNTQTWVNRSTYLKNDEKPGIKLQPRRAA